MPTIRLTGFFKDDDGHGWSETHDRDGGTQVTSLTAYLNNFNNLMQTLRRPMLGGDCFYLGCRASYRTADGTIAGDNIVLDPPLRGQQTSAGVNVDSGPPEAAVKVRFRNDASTARSDVYIRGMWRQVVAAGVLDFTSPIGAAWKSLLDQYTAGLVLGGYGWQGTNPSATSRGRVTGYVQNVDETVTLNVTPTNSIALPAQNTRIAMKFARINKSNSNLNRLLTCIVGAGSTTVTTTELIAVSPFVTAGTYIATVKGFIPYAATSYARLSQRKTGRPFGVGRGRLPATVLH